MKTIYPMVMNTDFERLCVIDDYISLIWTSRYYECGDFELCLEVNDKTKTMIQRGYYIMRDDDENIGIVEDISIQHTEDTADMIVISGRFLSSILGRRIIEKMTQVYGTPQACLQTLIDQNAINPTTSARQIPNLTFTSTVDLTETIRRQFTGDNLLSVIEEICMTYGIGFKTLLTDDHKFAFQLYQGTDRSYDQSENPYVIFSDVYENLLSAEYEENYMNVATDVLVAGEGEGTDRKTVWVNDGGKTGLNRYEVYEDARNATTNNGEISDAVYYEQLREEGKESLTQFTQLFTGTVYFTNVEYGKDVKLGDICVIENSRWGIAINSKLVQVIESVNESGEYSILPTFGL